MPEPLDYRNPKRHDAASPSIPPPQVLPAIPIEFDVVVTRSQDHGAARAVENQLTREGIETFRSEGEDVANRWVELRVRATDSEQASKIASQILARRNKLKSLPRQVVDPPRMPGEPDGGSGMI